MKAVDSRSQFEQATYEYLADLYESEPIMATGMGVHDFDHLLPNRNQYAIDERLRWARAYLHKIDRMSVINMDNDARLDFRLARACVQADIVRLEQVRPYNFHPTVYLEDARNAIVPLLTGGLVSATDRAETLVSRLLGLPELFHQARANLQMTSALHLEAAQRACGCLHALFERFLPEFGRATNSGALAARLAEATQISWESFAEFEHWLSDDLAVKATDEFGLGKELFEYQLRVREFVEESSSEMAEIACGLLAEAESEANTVAAQIDSTRNWREILHDLRCDSLPADRIMPAYRNEIARAREFVASHRLAGVSGIPDLVVQDELEVECKPVLTSRYVPPARFDHKQSGSLQIQSNDMNQCPLRVSAIVIHGAYPGHHLQNSLARGVPSRIRHHFSESMLLYEGWAAYCQPLMCNAGYSSDPRFQLTTVTDDIHRACRMLIDVGLHTGSMLLPAARAMLVQRCGMDKRRASTEVEEIALDPGCAVAPILGRRVIDAIRSRAERRSGNKFSIGIFHDELLSFGTVPPRLIRDAMFEVE